MRHQVSYHTNRLTWTYIFATKPSPIMDLFSSLAPELGHENLLHLKTWSNIAPLLQASPAMLAQYIESKELIRRAFLGAEFDGSVPQDALGVALFPPLNTPTSDEDEVRRHARRWALAQLPDPFQHQDHATVECLDRLYDRLSPFMEDYITKATSVFPPRVDALSGAERRRLLKAFLKYELLCKIYQMTQRVRPPTPHDDLFAAVFGNRAWEREAIRCVNGYVRDLYEEVFARLADSWLPDVPHTLATEIGAQKQSTAD
ncbi:hypothetical protein ACJ41O_000734 [Fusarium nematophilum]